MDIRCVGGTLDGKTVKMDTPEEVINQNILFVLRVHRPYPKKPGMKTADRLLSYTEQYNLVVTEDGPLYRLKAPFAGVRVGGVMAAKMEGGGYEIWADREGNFSNTPPAEG